MKSVKKTIFRRAAWAIALLVAALAFSVRVAPCADIYRWVDETGVLHFTDDPGSIPPKYRGRQTQVLKGPPASDTPSLSTIESAPARAAPVPPAPEPRPAARASGARDEAMAGQAEQLRAKIAAKEQFIDEIDRKQSTIRNPLGNRFVSPGDLDLYAKYRQELPQDRDRLRAIESRLPAVR
ncbi:MAG: DUF4124 domain-containing protein [Verrucomicrobiota bacterium]